MKFILIALFISLPLMAHEDQIMLPNVEVIGHQENSSLVDFIPSITKLQGKELQKKRQTSLGDTLQNEAGVTSTSFGPSSSRPVIRGLDGDRVRILQNGLGTLDASTQSLDHAIPVDTLTLESIEIVRGPMSLLYGSSAVGGVVNLVTNRVHSRFEEGFHSEFITQAETVNKGTSHGALMNYGKNNWMVHIDGSTRNLMDQKIPKYARTSKERRDEPLDAGKSEAKGELPNSFNKQNNLAAGVSRIFDKGYLGVSFNHFETDYGPVAEEEVTINMLQNRYELHGEYKTGGLFEKIRLKSAQSNYVHKEIEGGATGTRFKNNGNETRLEGINQKGDISGVTGIQTQISQFGAEGDEAFLPKTSTEKYALFTYQELKKDKQTYSGGARVEPTIISKKSSVNFGNKDEKSYTAMNGSLGHQYRFNEENSLSSSFSFTERAPNFQELYSDGAHLATATYEEGDKGLTKERAYAVELSYKHQTKAHQITMNAYSQVFNNFIFLDPTGATDTDSDLPIYEYGQANALFYGADIETKNLLVEHDGGNLSLVNKFDIVRAKNTQTGKNIPRISPPRFTAGLEYAKDTWSSDIEVQYVADQTKTAVNETRTKSYYLTNIGYHYDILGETSALSIFARVRNIFDVEARSHISTLKEIAPLPGRNFILGLQFKI